MPEYSVLASDRAAHELSMAANVETVVRFLGSVGSVEIFVLESTAPVYFTVDDSPATVAGPRCGLLFSGQNSAVVPTPWDSSVVRLISSSSAVVSVVS